MKNPILINTKHYLRAALIAPVICLVAFTGCSSIEGTAKHQTATTNRVTTYMEQAQEKPADKAADQEPDPTYEWFY
jgi:hypothetical protein